MDLVHPWINPGVIWYGCASQFFLNLPQSNGPHHEKPYLRGFGNNTDADQPAHPHGLFSAFVIRFLESTVCKLATGEISIH